MIRIIQKFFLLILLGVFLGQANSAYSLMAVSAISDGGEGGGGSGGTELSASGCVIALGNSVCTSKSSYVIEPNPRTVYDLYNETTGVKTSRAYGNTSAFKYNPTTTGTAADLKYGANTLSLRVSGFSSNVDSIIVNAICASGTSWVKNSCVVVDNSTPTLPPPVLLPEPGTIASIGFITLDADTCTIPVGSSSCSVMVSWSVAKGGNVEFITSGGLNDGTRRDDSYPARPFLNKPGENTATYTLKSNGNLLDTKTVTSKCVKGSSWNGAICSQISNEPVVTAPGSIIIESPTCAIPLGGSYCGSKISYSVPNPVAGKTVFRIPSFGGYEINKDQYPASMFMNDAGENTTTYTLKNNGVLLDTKTVTSKCIAGSMWNGNKCVVDPNAPAVTAPVATTSVPGTETGPVLFATTSAPVKFTYRGGGKTIVCPMEYTIINNECKKPIVCPAGYMMLNDECKTKPLPTTPTDTSKYYLKVDQYSILVRGFVESVEGDILRVRTIGGVWNVSITPPTSYVSLNSKRPMIRVGDFVGIQGVISQAQDNTFTAMLFRNRTLY